MTTKDKKSIGAAPASRTTERKSPFGSGVISRRVRVADGRRVSRTRSALLSLESKNISIKNINLSSTEDNDEYSVELNYQLKTGADGFGLPSLDLSKNLNMYMRVYIVTSESRDRTLSVKSNLRSQDIDDKKAGIITFTPQKLTFQTFLEDGSVNPKIKVDYARTSNNPIAYHYPFSMKSSPKKTNTLVIYVFMQTGTSQKDAAFSRIPVIENGNLIISSKIEDMRTDYYDNLFDFDIFSPNTQRKNSNISDLFASYGKDQDVKGVFFFDKGQFLIDNSRYGQILERQNGISSEILSMLNNSKIASIILKRREVKNILNFDPIGTKEKISVNKDQINKIVIETSDNLLADSPTLIRAAKSSKIDDTILAEISEINLPIQIDSASAENMYLKVYGFSDYDTLLGGKYSYSVSLRVQDGILLWLIESLKKLENAQNLLQTFNISRPTEMGSALAAVNNILNILFTLNSNIKDIETQRKYLQNLLKYEKTTSELMRHNLSLISKLSEMIGNAGVISQVNSQFSKSYSKNNSDLFFLQFEKDFKTYADFLDATNLNYDYLNINKNSNIGISKFTDVDFLSRCEFDFRRLIKDYQFDSGEIDFSQLNSDISLGLTGPTDPFKEYRGLFDFEENYCSFLAPKKINNTILTETNSFDNGVFNDQNYKNKYDTSLPSNLSISYFLQSIGISIGESWWTGNTDPLDLENDSYINSTEQGFTDDFNSSAPEAIPDSYDTVVGGYEGQIDETNKYTSFINSILREEEGWDLSVNNFDITNQPMSLLTREEIDNPPKRTKPGRSISSLDSTVDPAIRLRQEIENLPNHIKAIFASKSDKTVNQWLNMVNDFFASPDNYYMIKENYMNLVKIEVLSEFEKDSTGAPNVKSPKFTKLTRSKVRNLESGRFILCRATLYSDQKYKIGSSFGKRKYSDKYFLIEGTFTIGITGAPIFNASATTESPFGPEAPFEPVDVPEAVQAGIFPASNINLGN